MSTPATPAAARPTPPVAKSAPTTVRDEKGRRVINAADAVSRQGAPHRLHDDNG